jgi:hypothetical protein
MAVYKASVIKPQKQAIDDISFLSVNMQTADDTAFNQTPFAVTSSQATFDGVSFAPSIIQTRKAIRALGQSDFMYGQSYGTYPDDSVLDYGQGIVINLGIIDGETTFNIGIWNTNDYVVTVDDVSDLVFGMSIDGIAVGDTINPFQELNAVVTISDFAPPIINTEIVFDLDNGETISFIVVARIGIELIDAPQRLMNETLQFKTNIITTRNGKEQRLGLRNAPRQSFALKYEFAAERNAKLVRNLIEGLCDRPYLIPVWQEQVRGLSITAGESVVSCDTRYGDFYDGGAILIIEGDTYEILGSKTVTDTQITTVSPISDSYTSPLVVPVKGCYANIQSSGNLTQSGDIEHTLNMRVIESSSVGGYTLPALSYSGTPVITDGGFFNGRSQRRNVNSGAFAIDNQVGAFSSIAKWNLPKNSFEYGYVMTSQKEAWEFRQFVHYLNGMQKTVWVPTLDNDFTLTRNVLSTDTTLYIRNDKYGLSYGLRDFTDHIAIYDGTTWYFREVTGSGEIDSNEEFIQIDSALGTGYNIGDIKIMRMPLCRLLSDSVSIQWHGVGDAEGDLTFSEVEQ